MVSRLLTVVAVGAVTVAVGCGNKKDDGVIRREGEPDVVQSFDEKRMDAAIAEARSTLDVFVVALQAEGQGSTAFAIKKGFPCGDGGMEFIWLNEVRPEVDGFVGRINNEPVDAIGVQLGQTVQVARDEVVDWMFMANGKLQGGYTIVALAYGSQEQAEYEDAMGIDWSRYRFLREQRAIEQAGTPDDTQDR